MKRSNIKELQSAFKKLKYYNGPIDGLHGPSTSDAIARFQKDCGLIPSGFVNTDTYNFLHDILIGYHIHRIGPGDAIPALAAKYNTTVKKILTANPGLNFHRLKAGQELVIPYGFDLVDTDADYTYEIMERDIEGLKKRYPFIESGSAGRSVLGRNLYYIKLGRGPKNIFYNGAHHSLEWITALLLMKFAENFLKCCCEGRHIRGFNPYSIWNRSSIYIIPMVNPDGVDLAINGLAPDNPYYERLMVWNNENPDFSSGWQSNIRGVDLNHNYPARWLNSKDCEALHNINGPGPTRYSGLYPLSEPETLSVANFTRSHDFRLAIAYHSQGREIYWDFENMAPPEAKRIGERFSMASGYRLAHSCGMAAYAGYKDWFIKEYRKPAYTIEVGSGTNPLPVSQFDSIYEENLEILLLAATV
mgnify:CR=1 FL=1